MFDYEKMSLPFSFNYLFLLLALVLLVLYSVYTYRYTVPLVNPSKKNILTALRALGLLFIIFIVFEPKLSLAKKLVIKPRNLIYIDNSRSILINDGTKREEQVKDFTKDISSGKLDGKSSIFSFGCNGGAAGVAY